jgi:O-antigen/teichoic acid export membrane protein
MVSPQLFALLVLASGANFVVQSLAILLRSFKSEPFLLQSLIVASLTLVLSSLTTARWGSTGAVFSYFAATAMIGLPYAWVTFVYARRGYLTRDAHPV